MKKDIYLTIVIPSYNEEKNIRLGALEKVVSFLSKKDFFWEVLVVDDGSTDGSPKLIEEFISDKEGFRLKKNTHQGKAGTVISGMLDGRGKYILFTDLDQATPIRELDKILPLFKEGYDVVIGSRNGKREGAPFLRAIMGPAFMFLRRIILGLTDISDTQCGFKGFKKEAAEKIFHKLKLYGERKKVTGSQVTAGFDVEVLYLAKILKYRVKEVPVEWHYIETRRVNPIVDSLRGLLDLIRIRVNSIKGFYD
ncbi:MAG: Glycosyl transferase family 2 [Candidatus Gottesmanbacteria bacterium GW2011_GWC2_39_8]|uniref:dolichyl-phosphate beta-glucosyltransferase n=1 Tax=Candidatus Gottesmanbacteria bacterium GW2011_GWC2_39_8 TaxID=1618450 RepID=A0A0G0Q1S1_9BACT|nr:MAG: Glycosyl transferase family 2 [Candidatus Gottesmanbacteria bacterium GW2011_GWC2_39_8]